MEQIMEREIEKIQKEPSTLMVLRTTTDSGQSMGTRYWFSGNTCIPLYYDVNLVGNRADLEDTLIGFFYESGGSIWFLSMQEETDPVLMEVGTELTFADLKFRMMFTKKSEGYGSPSGGLRRSRMI